MNGEVCIWLLYRLTASGGLSTQADSAAVIQPGPRSQRFLPNYPATVPGTVQEAMQHITGDPAPGCNVLAGALIEEMIWNHTRTFTLTDEQAKMRARVVLRGA